jgi:hypothetical protein
VQGEKVQLVMKQAQEVAQLEARLRKEREERHAQEENLSSQLRKEREKRERMQKRLVNAEQMLESKEKELLRLTDIVAAVSSESNTKLAALEKVVKARNESYQQRMSEQESILKRHNMAFKALQDRVTELLEKKILESKHPKTDGKTKDLKESSPDTSAFPKVQFKPSGVSIADDNISDGDVLGAISGSDVSRNEDEVCIAYNISDLFNLQYFQFQLLQQLQALISEQSKDLSSLNDKISSVEKVFSSDVFHFVTN